jgi:hypothetical protein
MREEDKVVLKQHKIQDTDSLEPYSHNKVTQAAVGSRVV